MNQIIDEAYENYVNHWGDPIDPVNFELYTRLDLHPDKRLFTKKEFINKCKTNPEFSETWGLRIEERELSDEERLDWMKKNKSKVILPMRDPNVYNVEFSMDEFFRPYGVPTKLITITYNGTIEIYE